MLCQVRSTEVVFKFPELHWCVNIILSKPVEHHLFTMIKIKIYLYTLPSKLMLLATPHILPSNTFTLFNNQMYHIILLLVAFTMIKIKIYYIYTLPSTLMVLSTVLLDTIKGVAGSWIGYVRALNTASLLGSWTRGNNYSGVRRYRTAVIGKIVTGQYLLMDTNAFCIQHGQIFVVCGSPLKYVTNWKENK